MPEMESMTESGSVSLKDVRRVAELANLELTGSEEERMVRDLSAILGYVGQLNELDIKDVQPMAQVAEVLGDAESRAHTQSLRPDTIAPSLDRARVMAAAPETDGIFFKVPKVIER